MKKIEFNRMLTTILHYIESGAMSYAQIERWLYRIDWAINEAVDAGNLHHADMVYQLYPRMRMIDHYAARKLSA